MKQSLVLTLLLVMGSLSGLVGCGGETKQETIQPPKIEGSGPLPEPGDEAAPSDTR